MIELDNVFKHVDCFTGNLYDEDSLEGCLYRARYGWSTEEIAAQQARIDALESLWNSMNKSGVPASEAFKTLAVILDSRA